MKIGPVGVDFFHAGGQTDTDTTKLIVAFRNSANAPKNFEKKRNIRHFYPYIPVTCFGCLSMDTRGDIYSCANGPLYQLQIKQEHPSEEIAHEQCRTASSKRFTCNICTVDVNILSLCIKTQVDTAAPTCTKCTLHLQDLTNYVYKRKIVHKIQCTLSHSLWDFTKEVVYALALIFKSSYNSRMIVQIRTEKTM
jgi:hypothetical protein